MAMHRPLDLTILSAKDLKNVNFLSKMEVYAVAWLSSNPNDRQRTPTDREGGKSPSWKGVTLRFYIPDGVDTARLILGVQLRCERAFGDRDIGEVHVPIRELESGAEKSDRNVTYEVRRPSGKAKGTLNFSVKFGESVAAPPPPPPNPALYPPAAGMAYPAPGTGYPHQGAPYPAPGTDAKADHPVTAYPAGPSAVYPPHGAAGAYPPQGYPPYPPQGYGPPPPGYGYPPPAGYGYGAPQKPQKPKKNNLGLGLGAGLLGGALGGLLIGDMVSDAANYDAGYDAGFDDAGGFDF